MKITETILSTLHQPVLVLDAAFRPLLANPAFFHMLEVSPIDLESDIIHTFISGETCKPCLRGMIESAFANDVDVENAEAVCTLQTGRQLLLQVSAWRVPMEGAPLATVTEFRDITDERAVERKLHELNAALEKHVTTANAVNKELESYSDSVSHDLRTPLRFVSRLAHLLLQDPGNLLSENAVKQVNLILQATNEMGRLIENLLVFSQVSRDPIKKRRIDLQRLFQEAVKELGPTQEGRHIEFDIQDLEPCRGDRTLLREVALNLVGNAVKFTRPRRTARITIGCAKTEVETIYFVQDNGVGFDMKESDSLFVPFHRLHRSADFEGTGIGLALVRRIIERHGGRIWAESEVDKRTTFHFTLENETAVNA